MSPLRLLCLFFFLIAVLCVGGSALYLHAKGDRLLSVQTDSMRPTFQRGDAVLTKAVVVSDLKIGDIISYRNPADDRVIVTHRLIEVNYQTGKLITAGDHNTRSDIPVPGTRLVGKVYKIVPGFGSFLNWLRTPQGLASLVYVPAGLVILYESRHLAIRIKHKKYQQHRYSIS